MPCGLIWSSYDATMKDEIMTVLFDPDVDVSFRDYDDGAGKIGN